MSITTRSGLIRPVAAPDRPWLPALPHIAVALVIWPVFGMSAFVTGVLLAALASFVVYLPLTALALNRGQPIRDDAPAPAFTWRAQTALFGLWSATAWLGAGLVSVAG